MKAPCRTTCRPRLLSGPSPSVSFPEEKTRAEVATFRYIAENTTIPAGCPKEVLASVETTYPSSYERYCAMADQAVAQRAFQRNDAVESEDDCRDKFVARYLFRCLIRDQTAPPSASAVTSGEPETFRLWCDDIRPNSVLLDDDSRVVGVIDWEWSYLVPASVASDPPWWLRVTKPEYDLDSFDSWVERYSRSLDLFLEVLEEEERKRDRARKGSLTGRLAQVRLRDMDAPPLSVRMRNNWETGEFWVNYAARKPYAFEPAFWKQVDVRFFGPDDTGGYEDRLSLLPENVQRRTEWFVKQKMKEDKEHRLVHWRPGTATTYRRAILSALD